MRALLRSQRPYTKDTLAVNLDFLKKQYSIDLKKIPMNPSTFQNYTEGTSAPSIPTLIKFMELLKDPHNNLTVDEILFKDITPEEGYQNQKKPKKNSMFNNVRSDFGKKRKQQKGGNHKPQARGTDPREKLHITEAEYKALLKPHSKEDLAYINRDDGMYGEADPPVGRQSELSTKELREIDAACNKYMEAVGSAVGSKDMFNPSDIGTPKVTVFNAHPNALKNKGKYYGNKKKDNPKT